MLLHYQSHYRTYFQASSNPGKVLQVPLPWCKVWDVRRNVCSRCSRVCAIDTFLEAGVDGGLLLWVLKFGEECDLF